MNTCEYKKIAVRKMKKEQEHFNLLVEAHAHPSPLLLPPSPLFACSRGASNIFLVLLFFAPTNRKLKSEWCIFQDIFAIIYERARERQEEESNANGYVHVRVCQWHEFGEKD